MPSSGYTRIDHNISIKPITDDSLNEFGVNKDHADVFKHRPKLIASLSIVFITLMALVSYISRVEPTLSSKASYIPPYASVILTADDGSMVGVSEASEIKAQLVNAYHEKYDQEKLFCEDVTHGILYGSNIILATTGIGHDRAALCLRGLLSKYHLIIKDIMFLGTGGFSPAVGGILNYESCDQPAKAKKSKIVPIGSVCVSPITTNWDCHKCVWPPKVESACFKAPCSMHDRADIFGDYGCSYYTTTELADEMLDAAEHFEFDTPNEVLSALTSRYWGAMSNGTGERYDEHLGNMRPRVYDYTQCAEATSNTFWVGTPYDELGREYVADVINNAFKSELYHSRDPPSRAIGMNATKHTTLTVSAMEGVGWMEVLALEEVLLKYSRIPAVNVRGAADYVTPPVKKVLDKQGQWDGNWEEMSEFSEDLQGDAFTTEGYLFAMRTTSAIVLNLFKQRELTGSLWKYTPPK